MIHFRQRLGFFKIFFILGLGAVFFRVVQIQLQYGDRLKKWTKSQDREIELKGERGKIRDRMGRELASSVETLSFFMDPSEIENAKKFSIRVGRLIRMNPAEIYSKYKANKNKRFVWLKRQVDAQTRVLFEGLKNNKIEGLGVIRELRRQYPQGDSLAPLLGRVSIDGEGLEGIEREFDKKLQGGVSLVRTPRDARGRLFYIDKDQLLSKGEAGNDVYLTIDLHLQSLVETALDNFKNKYSADSAMALVVDPLTNDILVWAQNPRIQANGNLFRNFGATDPIEPGSVMKPLVMSWALEKNLVHEKTVFKIPQGQLKVGDKVFKDVGHKTRDHFTPEEILKYSSNVGAVTVGQRIGFKGLWELFEKLGFTEKSGLALSSESRGILRKPLEYQKVEQATMSFGQGFASTPLQIIRAFSVLAGDGRLRPLKLFKDLNPSSEEKAEKVLSPKTLPRIRKLMEAALADGGTAMSARVEGYTVAGKTGTSQKTLGRKGYAEDSYWSSFVGFFPSDEPRYLIYAAFDNPKGDIHTGGKTAAPLFADIAKICLRNDDPLLPTKLPDVDRITRELAQVSKQLSDDEQGDITEEELAQLEHAQSFQEEALQEEGAEKTPALVGLHLKNALKVAEKFNLNIKLKGRGHFVMNQIPNSGAGLKKEREVVLYLK
jgi:cell division protein FtsI (penicillin-binding protein 3)